MEIPDSQDPLLSSTQAARLIGVHPASIKRWANQGKLKCVKTPGGHRRFLKSAVLGLAEQTETLEFVQNLLKALIAGKQMQAEAILLNHWGQLTRWENVGDEIGIMLEEIGIAWLAGRLRISEEHVASATLLRSLSRIRTMIPTRPTAPTCALATVPGDEHTLGLAICELVLSEHDWQTLWLGRYTPVDTLIEVITRSDVSMLALSASAYSSTPSSLGQLLCQIGPIALASGTEIVLGGSGSWPKNVYETHRMRSYAEFGQLLRQLPKPGEQL